MESIGLPWRERAGGAGRYTTYTQLQCSSACRGTTVDSTHCAKDPGGFVVMIGQHKVATWEGR